MSDDGTGKPNPFLQLRATLDKNKDRAAEEADAHREKRAAQVAVAEEVLAPAEQDVIRAFRDCLEAFHDRGIDDISKPEQRLYGIGWKQRLGMVVKVLPDQLGMVLEVDLTRDKKPKKRVVWKVDTKKKVLLLELPNRSVPANSVYDTMVKLIKEWMKDNSLLDSLGPRVL